MNRNRSRGKEKTRKDPKQNHYQLVKQEIFNQRYMFVAQIQDGTFGRVVRVYDRETNDWKAMKIIKSMEKLISDAKIEFNILREVNAPTRLNEMHPGHQKIVKAYEAFNHKSNYCIVFEDLGLSLFDCMKINQIKGFNIQAIQQIVEDCLQGLDYIHSLGYTHTDLKPENILFEKKQGIQQNFHVKIIDLGGAVNDVEQHTSLINTRQYRAPEVILRNRWTKASDMWCFACVLLELYTGEVFFRPGNNDFFHLALIEKASGPIPLRMIEKADMQARDFFNDYQLNDSYLKWPIERLMVEKIKEQKEVGDLVPEKYELLRDLILKLLVVEPEHRMTAKEALKHEFLKHRYNM